MGRKAHVAVKGTNKVITVEEGATLGATLGVNLFDQAGNLLTLAALAAALGVGTTVDTGTDPQGEPALTIWENIGQIPDDAYTVLGNPTAAAARPIDTKLVAQFFPQNMVTILSSTEFEIVTALVDIHGDLDVIGDIRIRSGNLLEIYDAADTDKIAISHDGTDLNAAFTNTTDWNITGLTRVDISALTRINVPSGTDAPLTITGDTGSTTRPAISVENASLQGNRQLLHVYETTAAAASKGFWLQANLSGTFANNFVELGFDYTSGGDAANAWRVYSDGRWYGSGATEGQETITWDPRSSNALLTLRTIGDCTLELIADTDNTGGENHNAWILFSQDGGAVVARVGLTGDAGGDPFGTTFTGAPANTFAIHHPEPSGTISLGTENVVSFLIDASNDVNVRAGRTFRIYDSTNADTIAWAHDGTNATLTFGGTTTYTVSGAVLRFASTAASVSAPALRLGDTGSTTSTASLSLVRAGSALAALRNTTASIEVFLEGGTAAGRIGTATNHELQIVTNAVLRGGWQASGGLRIYDSAGTDYWFGSHDGTNFTDAYTNTTSLIWTGITGLTIPTGFTITTGGGTLTIAGTGETLATFADDGAVVLYHNNTIRIQTSANGVEIPGGSSLRIQDAANTDYGQFAHDGTDFLTTFVNTGKWDITVTELELNGDLDLDGIFDNDQSVALGGGATATLGTIGGSGPTAAGQSEWLRIRINGADRWIPVWL